MEINLLPNLVIARRRQAQIKRLATLALIGWGVLVVVVAAASFGWNAYQASRLNQANSQYSSLNASVNSADNKAFRSEALAVQASLNALSGLFGTQQKMSIITDRLAQLTPRNVRLREVDIIGDGTLKITANSNTYADASTFLYALKQSANTPAKDNFTKVSLTGANDTDAGVAFTINATFVKGTADQ